MDRQSRLAPARTGLHRQGVAVWDVQGKAVVAGLGEAWSGVERSGAERLVLAVMGWSGRDKLAPDGQGGVGTGVAVMTCDGMARPSPARHGSRGEDWMSGARRGGHCTGCLGLAWF